jgi:hypothetical protein
LGQFITEKKGEGFDCYMWWPQGRELTQVKSMGFEEKNAKFLVVEYYGKPKGNGQDE